MNLNDLVKHVRKTLRPRNTKQLIILAGCPVSRTDSDNRQLIRRGLLGPRGGPQKPVKEFRRWLAKQGVTDISGWPYTAAAFKTLTQAQIAGALLKEGPLTLHELIAATEQPPETVKLALYKLCSGGRVRIEDNRFRLDPQGTTVASLTLPPPVVTTNEYEPAREDTTGVHTHANTW